MSPSALRWETLRGSPLVTVINRSETIFLPLARVALLSASRPDWFATPVAYTLIRQQDVITLLAFILHRQNSELLKFSLNG